MMNDTTIAPMMCGSTLMALCRNAAPNAICTNTAAGVRMAINRMEGQPKSSTGGVLVCQLREVNTASATVVEKNNWARQACATLTAGGNSNSTVNPPSR